MQYLMICGCCQKTFFTCLRLGPTPLLLMGGQTYFHNILFIELQILEVQSSQNSGKSLFLNTFNTLFNPSEHFNEFGVKHFFHLSEGGSDIFFISQYLMAILAIQIHHNLHHNIYQILSISTSMQNLEVLTLKLTELQL